MTSRLALVILVLFILVLGELLMPTPVTSQSALQTYQARDYMKNVLGLWWETKEVRLRQLREYREALVQNPKNLTLVLATGVLLTSLAVPESERASPYAPQGLSLIQEYLDQNPRDAVALAYFCTARSLVLRNNGNFLEQAFQIGPILDAMDRAVATCSGQSEEWLVRLARANLLVRLPDLLGRKEAAYQDFLFVVRARDLDTEVEVALPTVFYYLGRIEHSRGKFQAAQEFWERARAKAEALHQTATEEYFALVRR